MRLSHILGSLLILCGLILAPILLFFHRGKLQGGPEILGTFLIFWWFLDIITPSALLFAWLKKKSLGNTFTFTLLALLNLYFGSFGIYHLMPMGTIHASEISFVFFLLNILWACIIIFLQISSNSKQPGQS